MKESEFLHHRIYEFRVVDAGVDFGNRDSGVQVVLDNL